MSAINDGGPAFPVTESNGMGNAILTSAGMTLRDYFAAKAMQGMMARPGSINAKQDAEFAYMLADAMLAARAKATGSGT